MRRTPDESPITLLSDNTSHSQEWIHRYHWPSTDTTRRRILFRWTGDAYAGGIIARWE